jgi:outer membrane protein assembly factor BamC
MILQKPTRWLALLLLLWLSTGCSYIKSLFPDKERDYQFRTEIPELIIPDDLKAHKLPGTLSAPAATVTIAEPASASAGTALAAPVKPDIAASPQIGGASRQTPMPIEVDKSAPAVVGSSLRIDQMQKQAWRLVARALSKQNIEIIERNMDQGYFYVKYDPDAVKPEDSSVWDEMLFLFGEDPSHEKEYRISLLEVSPQETEVTIQNSEGKTIADHAATALLKSITDGINNDIPTDAKEAKPANGDGSKLAAPKGDGPLTTPAP